MQAKQYSFHASNEGVILSSYLTNQRVAFSSYSAHMQPLRGSYSAHIHPIRGSSNQGVIFSSYSTNERVIFGSYSPNQRVIQSGGHIQFIFNPSECRVIFNQSEGHIQPIRGSSTQGRGSYSVHIQRVIFNHSEDHVWCPHRITHLHQNGFWGNWSRLPKVCNTCAVIYSYTTQSHKPCMGNTKLCKITQEKVTKEAAGRNSHFSEKPMYVASNYDTSYYFQHHKRP